VHYEVIGTRALAESARLQAEPRFRARVQAPHAGRASIRAHPCLWREGAATRWTAHLRAQVTV